MKIVITGGGTGGHIYPALEVAYEVQNRGAQFSFMGSIRGKEGAICRARNIPFEAFRSAPLYSMKSLRGWRSLISLLRAVLDAKVALRKSTPDCVFSTGGYSAAPIVAAANSLRIPYALHECNSIPGRTNRMFIRRAKAFTCTFRITAQRFPTAIRTGQPIRSELRAAAAAADPEAPKLTVLALGGSQGSVFINKLLTRSSKVIPEPLNVLLATGPANSSSLAAAETSRFHAVPYLEAHELAEAYSNSVVAVARSGGTVAEFALFGLPSVLVPLPTSADDHQLHNANEFVELGGATILEQHMATGQGLARQIRAWLEPEKRAAARLSLQQWDCPNATADIASAVLRAATGAK